ncbi:S-adenosyl-L-methionine-dependent methyltransferase [Polychytrium aggregatum]|uniref:S-adenosyl-L-methionine-dependent methyltransferase n=1 Tax=Polychytrium aggregatum TaxID=110093 RepID=UPI0022FE012A|nr:S-adenosyl-L-methionine-dependent methyltransferase [Polychytrium aggregatum]KAI9207113.1 S-adenosyl-L-methionine-dependent methyltransferase [Polychytrium aggregatum]
MSAQQSDFWSPSHYSTHAAFVPVLTSNIVTLLDPKQDERIFDLGCGDGVLTQELVTRFGARVVGTDSSPAMIEAARAKAAAAGIDESRLRYDVVDGQRLEEDIGDSYKGPYDAVFSNAAIHWMKQDPEAVVRGVRQLLRPGGRFVAEFGGHLNVATIHSALIAAVGRRGKDGVELSPWFFPTADEYKTILERNGFEVESIGLFPRQTDLPTDVGGWVDTFGAPFLKPFSEAEAAQIRHEVVEQLRPVLCDKNGKWVVDYVRLRVRATLKP